MAARAPHHQYNLPALTPRQLELLRHLAAPVLRVRSHDEIGRGLAAPMNGGQVQRTLIALGDRGLVELDAAGRFRVITAAGVTAAKEGAS